MKNRRMNSFPMCRHLLWTFLIVSSQVVSGNKAKSSIFNGDPIRFQDFGKLPATSTIPLYDCSKSHRQKTGIPNAFEVSHNKEWHTHTCEEGLKWNQTMCRCEFPNGRTLTVQCRDYRTTSQEPTGKYEQFVNGQWIARDCSLAVAGLVWSQEACQCVWGPKSREMIIGRGLTPCDIMLNMTFEDGIKDNAKNSFVEVARGGPVPTFTVNKRDSVDGNKAAYFNDTALNVWYFAGNELGTSLRVEFRFKMTSNPVQTDKYQIFLSNGCNISFPGYTTPSLAIGYRAADQSYLLAFETTSARKAIVCTRKLGVYDWHTVSLIYEDGTLLFRVDDQPCIISHDFSGPVQKTPCPLTIGADPLVRESVYKGYIDNLLIARYCQRFIDTDQAGHANKRQGPMPVEPASSMKDVRTDPGKRISNKGGNKHNPVTSTKYMSELPKLRNTEPENTELSDINSENYGKTSEYIDNTEGSGKTGLNKPGISHNINEDRYFENEWSSYERAMEYANNFRKPENINGKVSVTVKTQGLENGIEDFEQRSRNYKEITLSETTDNVGNEFDSPDKKDGQNYGYIMKGKYINNENNDLYDKWESDDIDFTISKEKNKFEKVNEHTEINRHHDNYIADKTDEYEHIYEGSSRTPEQEDRFENSEKTNRVQSDNHADQNKYTGKVPTENGDYSNREESKEHSNKFVGIHKNNRIISADLTNDNTKKGGNHRNINKHGSTEDEEKYGKKDLNPSRNSFVGDFDSLRISEHDGLMFSSNQNIKKRTDGMVNKKQFKRYENGAVNTDNALNKVVDLPDVDVKGNRHRDEDFRFPEESDNIRADLNTKSLNPGDASNGLTKSMTSMTDVEKINFEPTDSSNMLGSELEKSENHEDLRKLFTDKQNEAERIKYLNGRLHWYDNGDGPKHIHLTGINLSQGSAFIMDRSNRRKQRPSKSIPNLIKGRRRFGSKKNSWYDKVDTPNVSMKAPLQLEQQQNLQIREHERPFSDDENSIFNDNEEIMNTAMEDLLENGGGRISYIPSKSPSSQTVTDNYSADKSSRDKSSQDSFVHDHRQNDQHKTSSPKTTAVHKEETVNGFVKSVSEASTGSDSSLDFEEDYNLHFGDELFDSNGKVVPGFQSTRMKYINKGEAESRTDKQLDKSLRSSQQNSNVERTSPTDNSTPIVTIKRTAGWYNQDNIQMISPYNGIEYEKSHASEVSKRHLDIPVQTTKAKNNKSWKKKDHIMAAKNVKMTDK